jgi:predicted small secreted protein
MGTRTRRGNQAEGPIRHTRRMRTARLLVTLALCATVAAGCGTSSSAARDISDLADAHPSLAPVVTSTTATTTVSGITAEYKGPITQDDSYASTGISLSVPPTDAKPTLSWQRAVGLCFSGAGICNRTAGTIRVSLAVGYNPQSGAALPDGSIEPIMNHTLVYVLAQPLGPCAPTGPGGARARASTFPSCTGLSFVDAHTGKGATAVSGPSIRDPGAA